MYKIALLLIVVTLSSCNKGGGSAGDTTLLGEWESKILSSTEIGEFTYKYRFLDEGLYEFYINSVDENGAFVTWGEYELIGEGIIKTQAKYIGGIIDGNVVEKDEFDPKEGGDSGQDLINYKFKSKNEMVLLWSNGEHVVFKKGTEQGANEENVITH